MREPNGLPMREWAETIPNDGLVYYTTIFNQERVIVTSSKGLGEVLVQKSYEFIKPPQLRNGLGRILGVGILLAEGDEHKRQRRILQPAFAFRHVKDLYPLFWAKSVESVEIMAKDLDRPSAPNEHPSDILEIQSYASRATLDIIGVAGLGQDFGALQDPNSKLVAIYRRIFAASRNARRAQFLGAFIPLWLLRRLPMKRNFEIDEAVGELRQVCYQLINDKRAKMEKGHSNEVDILSVAMESGGFSDEDLVNQLLTFLAAGHETTASSMTWAIYVLCKHPDIQKRLRAEVRAALPSTDKHEAKVTATDIDHIPYLHAVCNEVLRVWAPVPMTFRVAAQNSTILDQPIPKGTTVVMSPWATNHDANQWGPDAAQFNPDRWMTSGKSNNGGAESNYSFLTFLHGPRSCIGLAFAKAEFACLLAAWVGKFEFEFTEPNFEVEIQGGVTARPKGGLPVRVKRVEGW